MRAVASLTDALVEQGMIGEDSATCVAEGFIAGVGLDALVDAGFFDEDFNYVDQPQDAITPEDAEGAHVRGRRLLAVRAGHEQP